MGIQLNTLELRWARPWLCGASHHCMEAMQQSRHFGTAASLVLISSLAGRVVGVLINFLLLLRLL